MAGLYIPVDASLCALRYSLAGDPREMIVTLGVQTDGTEPDPNEIAHQVDTAVTTAPALHPDGTSLFVGWQYNGTYARLATATGVVAGEYNHIIPGTAVGETLPNNCAILVRKLTAFPGRHNRGRMYFPPFYVSEGNVSKLGSIAAAQLAAFQTALNGILSNIALPGNAIVGATLLHYPTLLDPTPAATPITAFSAQSLIATVRRRLRP